MNQEQEKYWQERLKKIKEKKPGTNDNIMSVSPSLEKLKDKYLEEKDNTDNDMLEIEKGPTTSNKQIKVEYNEMIENDEDAPVGLSKKSSIKLDDKDLGWEG